MKTCAVKDLFDVRYGNGLELAYLRKDSAGINFVARGRRNNGVSAKVKRLVYEEPFPAGSITVAVSGSVMESFLQKSPFYTAYHVMVLSPLPGIEMTDSVKLYYCECLRRNKFRYSFGRQANETLKDLRIPVLEEIPDYVTRFSKETFCRDLIQSVNMGDLDDRSDNPVLRFNLVPLGELFEIVNGLPATDMVRLKTPKSKDWIPLVRPSYLQETSIDAYVNRNLIPADKVFPSGTLYVSTNGQGSHTYSYVSVTDFVPNSDVAVMIPKENMTLREKLFYSLCITKNRFRFSYGRKPKGDKLESIMLPDGIPSELNDIDLTSYLAGLKSGLE